MPNNAPVKPCPSCSTPMRANCLPRHLPRCLGSAPSIADLYRVGKVRAPRAKAACHEWGVASRHPFGYGLLPLVAQRVLGEHHAHRAAWRLVYGPIPEGAHVLHTCDNPSCLRPEHLFLGDQSSNVADMWAKGRGAKPPVKRSRQP